ncbi:hypothetical protein HYFRA_00014041 [Hymenoscyphus fraxineus]|uniref:Thioesterase/thiol ester dehydrase-isomerase n=1 Tax=Hymenoscyphus fraxineus TaxID=746836 RepID=A0A9N9PZW4_9HELO|nr:hypothetical protein HYFRA_00014041 [Hymenoscyphus fraxineus]
MRILRQGLPRPRPLVQSIQTSCHANPQLPGPGTRHLHVPRGLQHRRHVKAAAKFGVALEEQTLLEIETRVWDPNFLANRPRYLADCRARLGKCVSFGIPLEGEPQDPGNAIINFNTRNILEYLGFALGRRWRGLVTSFSPCERIESIRWGDIDRTSNNVTDTDGVVVTQGHVNNKHYFSWVENARIHWTQELKSAQGEKNKEWEQMWTFKGTGLIVRSTKMIYKFPLTVLDRVIVYSRLRSLPKSSDTSFVLDTSIISNRHQRVAARCEEEIVVYDYTKKRQTPFPPHMTEALENVWLDQEKRQSAVAFNLFCLEVRLMVLEKLTWDRDGAVEDFGR